MSVEAELTQLEQLEIERAELAKLRRRLGAMLERHSRGVAPSESARLSRRDRRQALERGIAERERKIAELRRGQT